MTTFADNEAGSSVRSKINAAITTVDGLGTGDNLLLTAAERSAIAANTAKRSYPLADETKVGHLTVTAATNLDTIRGRIAELEAALVLMGTWDPSGAVFPGSGSAQAGEVWIASGPGAVDSEPFVAGDWVIAASDDAATTDVDDWTPVHFSSSSAVAVREVSGTTDTLVIGDAGGVVESTGGSSATITIPANAAVAFAVGTVIGIDQAGAGTVTIEGDTGVTVNGTSAGSVDILEQWQGASLRKRATDEWIVTGAVA